MPVPRLTLTLFGGFDARYDGRPLTGFATDKVRALFAYLAVESGKAHRRETLAALLWPDFPDETARGNLRKSLYRLRQALQEGAPALPDQLVGQTRQTITLHPEAILLDTASFDQLMRAAKESADQLALLVEIGELYQGEFLQGISIPDAYAFEEWLMLRREIFQQGAIDALTRLITLHEARNEPDSILVGAARLLALDPWHEQTHRQIMRAHRQKGHRPAAIAHYKELKTILHRDLGVEPSPTTTSLYEQIRVETTVPGETYAPPVPSRLLHFPMPLTPLVGRKAEIAYLTQTLQNPTCRLLVVTGPGGVGKTRLCIETGRRLAANPDQFADGLVFIPLAQVQDGELLIYALGQSLNLSFRPNADRRQELLNYLKNRELLLVLDNFEHLLSQTRQQAPGTVIAFLAEILAFAPRVTLLVTSREPLVMQGEWLLALEGLPYLAHDGDGGTEPLQQPAAQLFIQSARRFRPMFDPAAHVEPILEICRLTGGLPLALEIAAAWMRAYDPQEIAQRIAQSLDFLTSPYRDAPVRQRSIRAVITSAWEQLTPAQQNALAATAVFQGSFTARAALAVAEASVLDLATLVEKSLLSRTGERRYLLHELVRAFAAERLAASETEAAVRARHAYFYFSYLQEQLSSLNGPNPQEALVLLPRVLDNLRAAWHWLVSHMRLDLLQQGMYGIAQFLILTGRNREGEESFTQALRAIRQTGDDSALTLAVQSEMLAHLAWFQSGLGKNQEALDNARNAIVLAGRCQALLRRAQGLSILGWILQTVGHYDEAEVALAEAVTLFQENDRPLGASLALIRLGSVYWRRRDFDKTLDYYRQSLQIEERLQNKRGINRATGGIGLAYLYLEKYDEALVWMDKALALDRELGNRFGIPRHLGNLGTLHLTLGDYAQALACYQEAARLDREIDNKATLVIWLGSIGGVYRQTGDDEPALNYYDQAIALAEELGDRFHLCESLLGKGEVLIRRGDGEGASPLLVQGRQLADEVGRTEMQFRARLLEGRLLALTADVEAACRQLDNMLSMLADDSGDYSAQIYYERWQIGREPEYAHQALHAYQAALARAAKAEYRTRIEELSGHLSIPKRAA